jgi:hypothetical protein
MPSEFSEVFNDSLKNSLRSVKNLKLNGASQQC